MEIAGETGNAIIGLTLGALAAVEFTNPHISFILVRQALVLECGIHDFSTIEYDRSLSGICRYSEHDIGSVREG